jgi:hypothetical protein
LQWSKHIAILHKCSIPLDHPQSSFWRCQFTLLKKLPLKLKKFIICP